jgi:uncharacterized membrane protein
MEKLFKARWWDYHNRKFNINGRICLETLIPFGILGTVLLKYANPFILRYLEKIPHNTLVWILKILIIVIVLDTIISFAVMLNFKKTAKKVEAEGVKDNTEEMNEVVRETAKAKAQEIKADATEAIEDVKENIEEISHTVTTNVRIAKRKAHYTSQKIQVKFDKSTEEFKQRREVLSDAFKKWLGNSVIVRGAAHISNTIKYNILFKNNKEYTEAVKEEFKTKSWLAKRLTDAYPGLVVISKKFKDKK